MAEADDNRDGRVTWAEYLQDAFGVDHEEDVDPDDGGDSGLVGTTASHVNPLWASSIF